ncbi:MAG TPA: hypothetical protein VJ839_08020 [Candidatus Limnocylindria bacterium]|nr:hypothetical protein [Candidatus Limnocylindria bacterium]
MTRSDGDIERQLEDWLNDEARPMPPHVLESSLEAVSRTTQVGGRPRFGIRLNQRLLMLAATAAVLVLVVLGGPTILVNLAGLFGPQPGAGPTSTPTHVLLWDPAADFLEPPNQQNPSPDRYGNERVWGYMRSWDGQYEADRFFALPNFDVALLQWYERDLVNLHVSRGPTGNDISLHGWSDGNRSNNRAAILAWRSPISGSVTVSGTVEAEDDCPDPADGVFFSVARDAETLEAFHLALGQGRSFRFQTTIEVGQQLYFINDPGADSSCDTAVLLVAITSE